MKRLFFVLGVLLAMGSTHTASAQTAVTTCPVSYTCAFSAAETFATVAGNPNNPGQPDAYVGYLTFDASSNVTISGMMNVNGSVGPITGLSPGTCANGSSGAPATIAFADGSKLSFVTDRIGNPTASAPTELQFISTQDKTPSGTKSPTANQVRIGVCRQQ